MISSIDRSELLSLIEHQEAQIVDVLPPGEYAAGHIPGAINIPLKQLDAGTVDVLRRDKPVVVY
jgi:rhodanese-related sulfurtransferase